MTAAPKDACDVRALGRRLEAVGKVIEVPASNGQRGASHFSAEPSNTNGRAAQDARGAGDELAPIIPDRLPDGVIAGTDVAGAHLLAQHHGGEIRYCAKLGWLAWDGCRFANDEQEVGVSLRVENVARRLQLGAAELYRRSASCDDKAERARLQDLADELKKWATDLQSEVSIRRVIKVARTRVNVDVDVFDRDPWLLNCENGTIDLRTGELRPHRQSDLITKLARVRFDPSSACPQWLAFLEKVLPDEEVRAFVRRYFGYSLTGVTREQSFVVALGKGANGKTVAAETIRGILGDYTRDSPSDTFMQTNANRGTENDIARLRGARFVTAKETEEDRRLDEARVKQLTGEDTVTARFLFREYFEFVPSFKLWLYCNHRPKIVGIDEGIWRRILLVPFDVFIPKEERDEGLKERLLKEEASGILAWLVRGCLEWQRCGLNAPDAVAAATVQWRESSDEIRRFVGECCVVQPYASVAPELLFKRYRAWATSAGNKAPMGQSTLKARLEQLGEQLGFAARRTGAKGRFWDGIGLLAEEVDDEL